FMMVLPLGPFFAGPLGIPPSRIGFIGGSYTAAAAVSGVVCSFFLDRFERRGKALGAVMGAFSVSAVLGVPAGLELARWGGWRLPFFSVAGLGLVLIPLAIAFLPPLTGHLVAGRTRG